MVRADETALICDFAEYYHVLDWRALPLKTAAALAAGLRDDSRVKSRMAGITVDPQTQMLAAAVDRLGLLVWMKTKDATKGRNRPKSLLEELMKKPEDVAKLFDSPELFEAARKRIMKEGVEDVHGAG